VTTASVGDGARFAARPVSGGGTPTPRPRRHHRRPDCRWRARGGGVGERRWCGVRRIIRGGGGCAAGTDRRLRAAGRRDQVNLVQRSLDQPWPTGGFDPIVLSEVGYYLRADTLRAVLDRERPRLADGASIVAAHWRHPVDDYPISGDHANEIIGATTCLHLADSYRDPDVAIDVFDNCLRHIRGRGRRLASGAGRRQARLGYAASGWTRADRTHRRHCVALVDCPSDSLSRSLGVQQISNAGSPASSVIPHSSGVGRRVRCASRRICGNLGSRLSSQPVDTPSSASGNYPVFITDLDDWQQPSFRFDCGVPSPLCTHDRNEIH
jgi:hypothetical protein